jgi:hypothetical protein
MSGSKQRLPDFPALSKEELEIRLRQCMNDLRLTKEEARENALKYMELVSELGERNVELQALKDGLEEALRSHGLRGEGSDETPSLPVKELFALLRQNLEPQAGACGAKLLLPEAAALPGGSTSPALLTVASFYAEALLSACGEGSALSAGASAADGRLTLELLVSGNGFDKAATEAILNSAKRRGPWPGPEELLRRLSGCSVNASQAEARLWLECPYRIETAI